MKKATKTIYVTTIRASRVIGSRGYPHQLDVIDGDSHSEMVPNLSKNQLKTQVRAYRGQVSRVCFLGPASTGLRRDVRKAAGCYTW